MDPNSQPTERDNMSKNKERNKERVYLYGVDATTLQRFTEICEDAKVNRSAAIEALMHAVIDGRFQVHKQPEVILTNEAANELADAETSNYLKGIK